MKNENTELTPPYTVHFQGDASSIVKRIESLVTSQNKNDEQILATSTEVVHNFMRDGGVPSLTGVVTDSDKIKNLYAKLNKDLDGVQVGRRGNLEEDTRYKQFIPYTVIKEGSTGLYLVYRRLNGSGENRLHGKHSMGVGGHSNLYVNGSDITKIREHLASVIDETSLTDAQLIDILSHNRDMYVTYKKSGLLTTTLEEMIADNRKREIEEELQVDTPITLNTIGILNNESTPVDQVHVCLLGEGVIEDRTKVQVHPNEQDILEIVGWYTAEELLEQRNTGIEFEAWSNEVIDLINHKR